MCIRQNLKGDNMSISEKWKAPERVYRDSQTKNRLSFSVYNGELYISVWGSNGSKYLSEKLVLDHRRQFVKTLEKVKEASPGTKKSVTVSTYDFKGSKSWVPAYSIIIEKDNEQVFKLHVKVPRGDSSDTHTFQLLSSGGLTVDGQNVSKAASSFQAIDTLIYWLDNHVPIGEVISREKYIPKNNNNNGGGNSSNNNMPF